MGLNRILSFLFVALLVHGFTFAQTNWSAPRLLNPETGPQEYPYVAIGPNNELSITCSERIESTMAYRVAVYRSTDGGRNFSRSLIPVPPDSYVAVSPAGISYDRHGNIHVLWRWMEDEFHNYVPHLVISKSTDGGTTFTKLWEYEQPLFWVGERNFFIGRDNSIHLLRDSTLRNGNFVILYSQFLNGNPENMLTYVVPRPDTMLGGVGYTSLLRLGDTVHFCMQKSGCGISPSYYSKSTNGGLSFSTHVLADSFTRAPKLSETPDGRIALYARHKDIYSPGVLIVRFLSDTSAELGDSLLLPTRGVSFDGSKRIVSQKGRSYLTYTGYDGRNVFSCYYEFGNLSALPSDSAFFPLFQRTMFDVDSLGGKYLVMLSNFPGTKVYVSTKDVITHVQNHQVTDVNRENSINTSVNQVNHEAVVSIHIRSTVEGSLKLYDILGKEVAEVHRGLFTNGEHQFSINTANLASGTYFVGLQSRSGRIASKFILVH